MTEREPIFSESDDFLPPDDPRLRRRAPEVPIDQIVSPETTEDLNRMFAVARGEQTGRGRVLVGLAAPQIGIEKRIILVDVSAEGNENLGGLQAFINPEIPWRSATTVPFYEGCFSAAPELFGIVPRSILVQLHAFRPDGSEVNLTYHGYTARVIQHEIDHLDGREFTDLIESDADLHRVTPEDLSAYRGEGRWRVWPRKFPRDEWERIKKGTA